MSPPGLPLREFILLAQRDVQQAIEYLATPAARRVAPDAPAAVIASVGSLKLTVPVTYALRSRRTLRRTSATPPAAAPAAGPDQPVLGLPAPRPGYELVVATPGLVCQGSEPIGRVEIELITCPKQYGS